MTIRLHHTILRSAARLVPTPQRPDWLAEWKSELWYVLENRVRPSEALFFCLGAFRDALWLRWHDPHPVQLRWLQSPLRCLAILTAAAASAIAVFLLSPSIRAEPTLHVGTGQIISVQLVMIGLALGMLPAITSLSLGHYPAASRVQHLARWTFLGLKLILVLPIVAFGTFDLTSILSSQGVQPHAMLAGYVLAFRWALVDQRQRCPVCLRLLINPIRVGQPAQTFLELYGTEYSCPRGHGLLHVPEIPASYNSQHWLDPGSFRGTVSFD
jgi:hypothetical protein